MSNNDYILVFNLMLGSFKDTIRLLLQSSLYTIHLVLSSFGLHIMFERFKDTIILLQLSSSFTLTLFIMSFKFNETINLSSFLGKAKQYCQYYCLYQFSFFVFKAFSSHILLFLGHLDLCKSVLLRLLLLTVLLLLLCT